MDFQDDDLTLATQLSHISYEAEIVKKRDAIDPEIRKAIQLSLLSQGEETVRARNTDPDISEACRLSQISHKEEKEIQEACRLSRIEIDRFSREKEACRLSQIDRDRLSQVKTSRACRLSQIERDIDERDRFSQEETSRACRLSQISYVIEELDNDFMNACRISEREEEERKIQSSQDFIQELLQKQSEIEEKIYRIRRQSNGLPDLEAELEYLQSRVNSILTH